MLAEVKIGKGKVLISTVSLSNDEIVARSFEQALLSYMDSAEFEPSVTCTIEDILSIYKQEIEAETRKDWAVEGNYHFDSQKPITVNQEQTPTAWQPADNQPGHWWEVELPEAQEIAEVQLTLLSKGTYYYNISVSLDGEHYERVVNKTADTSRKMTVTDTIDTKMKYLRIMYGDVNGDAKVGHASVKLFEKGEG